MPYAVTAHMSDTGLQQHAKSTGYEKFEDAAAAAEGVGKAEGVKSVHIIDTMTGKEVMPGETPVDPFAPTPPEEEVKSGSRKKGSDADLGSV